MKASAGEMKKLRKGNQKLQMKNSTGIKKTGTSHHKISSTLKSQSTQLEKEWPNNNTRKTSTRKERNVDQNLKRVQEIGCRPRQPSGKRTIDGITKVPVAWRDFLRSRPTLWRPTSP
eukprot:PhF_6_TR26236/c0_g2_i1/m.37467